MYAEVSSVEHLSPSLLRVHLTGGTLESFEASAATDSYVNARFLPPGSPLTVPFSDSEVSEALPEHRPRPRRFTIRRWDATTRTLSIDFVVHGDVGYAGAWAQRARPGDRLQFSGPSGGYRPSQDVDWHLLAGDESALGAIGASLEAMRPGARALVVIVVDGPDHEIDLPSAGDVDITWLHRMGSEHPERLLPLAVEHADFPPGTFDAFVHGEAGEVRAVRRHLANDRGVDVGAVSISPYWRRSFTDEDWRSVKRQWMAEQHQDA